MKKLNLELTVGLFMIAGFLAFAYISLHFGEFSVFATEKHYTLVADFHNVSGLKRGAMVEMAGVPIGRVSAIKLNEYYQAQVSMLIKEGVAVTEDVFASIRTQGIIGDKFIKFSQGGADEILQDSGRITDTESAIDIEELISKFIFGEL